MSIISGDSRKIVPDLKQQFDACITDPPYGIGFMNKKWDDDVAFDKAIWAAVYAKLKPGAHVLAFGGTRTYHRLACAIEDAGFDIRDCLAWVYGQGMGKAGSLKPAFEPIVVARKPYEGRLKDNIGKYGVGGYFIEAARIPNRESTDASPKNTKGRWPANLIHDGSDEVLGAFPDAPGQQGAARTDGTVKKHAIYGKMKHSLEPHLPRADSGSATRFFYCAKATKAERMDSKHPTVKPIALMRYLIRLVTPPDALILDPFAGSGTTGVAALLEGRRVVLIEQDEDYVRDAQRRLDSVCQERRR